MAPAVAGGSIRAGGKHYERHYYGKVNNRKPVGSQRIFSLAAPAASAVSLVGDFTSWSEQPISMAKDLAGIWRVTVTLAPGRHSYRFIGGSQPRDLYPFMN